MQEHEYKARDKTVQKMRRDGLREENLRNKEEKRITGRDTDTEISRSEKKEELDFSKRRHERLKEEREMEQPEQSSRKPRYSREHADILDDEQDIATDADVEEGLTDDSSENPKSAFRTESIRGQPRGERAYLETVADSRDLRKKKMVRDYAAKERRKEKETSREEKAAKRESARYRETSEVMEDSLDKFHEEIKGKSKRERVLKEQRKKVSRLSFGDEGDGMVHGAGIGIRNPASAVKDAAVTAAHWKTHEEEDENAAVEGAHRAELAGESLENREEQVEKITEDILNKKTGCLKDWLVEVSEESDIDSDVITARSLLSRLEDAERFSIFDKQPEQEQPEATISFYVAECMEFPVMGEYHNNLTLEEAIKIYESIPAERLHGIKGIGFDLQDGDEDYSGEYELMSADRIRRDLIDMIPHYKESPLVQKAITDMEKYLDEKYGRVQEAEHAAETAIGSEQKPSAVAADRRSEQEPVSVSQSQPQKVELVSRAKGEVKKSVLQSLKDFQARAKAQEQNKTTEKSKTHKKGEVEL